MRISDWSSDVCSSDLGDMNPLHIDPDAARRAGFDRPILHGLCTYGIACRAVIEGFAGWDPERLASIAARFSAPVFPRSEERRVGKECVSRCRSGWSPYH